MYRYGATKYLISSKGFIINEKTKRELKLQDNGNGYKKVTLTINGLQVQKYVHRLVAQAFIANDNNKKQVNHINGIKSDNRVENLEWVTCSENQIHAHRTKLKSNGNLLWNGKFSKQQILDIFLMDKNGMKRYIIADKMKCSKSTITDILNGKRYKYI